MAEPLHPFHGVITGAGRGIGLAIAREFAQRGFTLALVSKSAANLDTACNNLSQEYGNRNLPFACDLSSKSEILKTGNEILTKLDNRIDLFVNNAGIFLPGSLMEEEDGTFEQLMNLNIGGAYHLTRSLRGGFQSPGAYIFNMCSTASFVPYVNGASYCISKYALLGFSRVLREEFKPRGIAVSAVMPGATFTDSWKDSGLPEERFIPAESLAKIIANAWDLRHRTVVEEIIVRPPEGDI